MTIDEVARRLSERIDEARKVGARAIPIMFDELSILLDEIEGPRGRVKDGRKGSAGTGRPDGA